MKGAAGIYLIEITPPARGRRFYIGQAKNLHDRKGQHLWRLRNRKHSNPILQAIFDKHGSERLIFRTLLVCGPHKQTMEMYEQAILDFYRDTFGDEAMCNVHLECVNSRLGRKASEETKAKMSAALRGRKCTAEQIERMRISRKGRKLTAAAIAKRTKKQVGLKRSKETREKMAAAQRGKRHSSETIEKIRAAKKGHRPSPEHIERLRILNTGRKMPQSAIDATAAKKRGRPLTPESIAKRQATRRANSEVRGYW